MATWDDVRRCALALPGTSERPSRDHAHWWVGGKGFVWERPLRRSDLDALGLQAQEGPVLGARVADEGVKAALISGDPDVYFTTPHFDGYPAVLVRLDAIDATQLRELITEAWLTRAPKRLAAEHVGDADKRP
ncbi:MmcQ/YjbR family DNA-binding protein [Streptacidiphilus rugosus]|uniref:MmcQ/YjbR family DNA-binding protein n=1 Tax=Streptacidiphilus rugosus TaxID=405783 RepID=UPI00056C0B3E|nr:MmcQ/YjbR family DNA-binding protein [Streptacidiphilus rugosus]